MPNKTQDIHVFDIKNLNCEYIRKKVVLELKELKIPSGKLIFVIGRSGIGKSTFIETLGLMNKTISDDPSTNIHFFNGNGQNTELKDAWTDANIDLAEFRRKHFSFIFQNTNLMPNFSSGENMVMSMLIKGITFKAAKKEVLSVMKRLALEEEVFDKKITELSGGQRQRLAFVRAITAEFTVLFGDEPTGNLDDETSAELMAVLKEHISVGHKTGIIVSHDLQLASEFADMIIPLTPTMSNDDRLIGELLNSNIVTSQEGNWFDHSGNEIADISTYLNSFLTMKKEVVS